MMGDAEFQSFATALQSFTTRCEELGIVVSEVVLETDSWQAVRTSIAAAKYAVIKARSSRADIVIDDVRVRGQ